MGETQLFPFMLVPIVPIISTTLYSYWRPNIVQCEVPDVPQGSWEEGDDGGKFVAQWLIPCITCPVKDH